MNFNSSSEILNEETQLIQNFVNHYQNLNHFKSITCGLWATDKPENLIDEGGVLFQIDF